MKIFGHRGAKGESPENTIAGLRHSIDRGVTQVEIDLRLSLDKKIVIVHDDNALRTTGLKQPINRLSARDLKKLDARKSSLNWSHKSNCGIPELKEVLKKCPEITKYQLEVKTEKIRDCDTIINELIKIFPNKKTAEKIIVTSFNSYILEKLSKIAPYISRGLVSDQRNALRKAKSLNCNMVCIDHRIATRSWTRQIKDSGIATSFWTVNNPSLIEEYFKWGVDSIITDYPSMALPLSKRLEMKS